MVATLLIPLWLLIASLGLTEVIAPMPCRLVPEGCQPVVAEHSVSWFVGSGQPGGGTNIVLYGHNPGVFTSLPAVQVGDTLEVADALGQRFTYQVVQVQIIEPTLENGKYVQPTGEEQVTLITCYGSDQRLVIIARRIE